MAAEQTGRKGRTRRALRDILYLACERGGDVEKNGNSSKGPFKVMSFSLRALDRRK